jgi:site-specific DNA-adenine methylase
LPFSILKYAGGKPWFLQHAERFLRDRKTETIVEPFAGKALVSFTLLNHRHAKQALLAEKDAEVRLFWESTRNDEGLAARAEEWTVRALRQPRDKQRDFVIDSILRLMEKDPPMSLLLRSRSSFNGILTGNWPAVTRRPLESWWPLTISSSLRMLYAMRDRFEVVPDAFDALAQTSSSSNYAFVDPPFRSVTNPLGGCCTVSGILIMSS